MLIFPKQQELTHIDVAPEERSSFPLPFMVPALPGEYAVTISFRLKEDTSWAKKGHEVAFGQGVIAVVRSIPSKKVTPFTVTHGTHNIGVRGENFDVLFSEANKFTNEKFTSGSFKNLQDQIEKAEAVLSNTEREEDEIAKAYEELLQAIIGLERKANKAALQAVIARAEAVLASSDCYTASTLDGLEELLADAKEVYQKEDAVQQEVNEAVKSLTLKVAEARLKGDVDGNGKIGTSDSVLLLQYAAEMTVLDEISAESADVNGDMWR